MCKNCADCDGRMNIWERIKQQISGKISTEAFDNWLSKAAFVRAEGDRLWVSVPDTHTRDWIQQEYSADIWSAVREMNLSLREIVYEIHGTAPANGNKSLLEEKQESLFAPSITSESTVHVRQFRGGFLQSVRARRGAGGGHQSVAHLQSAFYLRRSGHGQDASDARHRAIDGGSTRQHADYLYLQRAIHERDDHLHQERPDAAVPPALSFGRRAC